MTAIAAPEAPVTVIRNRKASTDLPVGTTPEGHEVVASIHSYHSKENRALVSVLSRVTIEQSSTPGFVVRQSFPMDSVRIMNEPVGRYSDKALSAFHDESLAIASRVRDAGENAKVNAIFAPVA